MIQITIARPECRAQFRERAIAAAARGFEITRQGGQPELLARISLKSSLVSLESRRPIWAGTLP